MNKITIQEWNKEAIASIKGKKGVYSVIINGKHEYIGSSKNLHKRVNRFYGTGYQSLQAKGIKFIIEILLFDDINEMVMTETVMINKYRPSKNINCIGQAITSYLKDKGLV